VDNSAMRRAFLIAALAAALAGPAAASEKKAAPNPTVLLSALALPIVVDGKLVNYVFVSMRLGLSKKADPEAMRAKEPYFRDALVRAAHRTPFVRPDNYAAIDEPRMKAALMREIAAIVGPGVVVSVNILRAQPQRYDGLPKPKVGPRAN
jgi:hypothetical protein